MKGGIGERGSLDMPEMRRERGGDLVTDAEDCRAFQITRAGICWPQDSVPG